VITDKSIEWFLNEVFEIVRRQANGPIDDLWAEMLSEEVDSEHLDEDEELWPKVGACTFERAGLMGGGQGIVLRVGDAEFQISILRSR
jgi:hypothetical protein